jgi:predicted 3-demethylubiquinone-9 3-methyltransferase (glyoxalase superfamily)
MKKIQPFLWFNTEAEAAADFYTSVFRDSEVILKTYYGKGTPVPEGTVMTVVFRIEQQEFVALNGGPQFTFSPAVSFVVNCKDQEEIDYYWQQLSANPEQEQCGWLQDRFGLSWQVIPEKLPELLSSPDPEKAANAMQAMMKMKKIVISDLQEATEIS